MSTARPKEEVDSASAPPAAGRFLTISMNADARQMGEELWRDRFAAQEIDALHLDLQGLANGTFVSEENLRKARDKTLEFLNEHKLRGSQKGIEIFARAKLSFMTWLGWEMRFSPNVVFHNYYPPRFRRFTQPELIRFTNQGSFRWLTPEPAVLPPSRPVEAHGDAVVIVDPIGKSRHEHQKAFIEAPGRPAVITSDAYRLAAPPGEVLQPDQLELVLADVVELIGRLRHERGVKRVHLGLSVPAVVAFFLGQQLNAAGVDILLYEFYSEEGGQYRLVFPLDRNVT